MKPALQKILKRILHAEDEHGNERMGLINLRR
jgi:hypothetical protein